LDASTGLWFLIFAAPRLKRALVLLRRVHIVQHTLIDNSNFQDLRRMRLHDSFQGRIMWQRKDFPGTTAVEQNRMSAPLVVYR
jgi:hypothetical protein